MLEGLRGDGAIGAAHSVAAVWSPEHRRHSPRTRAHLGELAPAQEVAARGDLLGAWLEADPLIALVPSDGVNMTDIVAVHDGRLARFLATVVDRWRAEGLPLSQDRPAIVPSCFPNTQLRAGRPLTASTEVIAELGLYCVDTFTVVLEGTWEAALAAVAASVTAARLVADGAPIAYAAVRPPGHHAGPRTYGGACFLNNAAVAANWLTGHGIERVAVVDLDAHHGNGTQEIFYTRADVFYGSLHADPTHEYPYWLGFAAERGEGRGDGANLNLPLPPGAGDEAWLSGMATLLQAVARFNPQVVVVSLGVDGLAEDPNAFLELTPDAYVKAGSLLADLGRPLLCVQEGGYVLPLLAGTVRGFLRAAAGNVASPTGTTH